jgi:hypothetical protein
MNIKKKIRDWLGISTLENQNRQLLIKQKQLEELISTLSSGVVDIHFKGQTQIYIVSKLGDGYFTHIDANFEGLESLHDFVKEVKKRFGGPRMQWDVPMYIRGITKNWS